MLPLSKRARRLKKEKKIKKFKKYRVCVRRDTGGDNRSNVLWEYGLDGWPWQEYQMKYSAEVTVLFCIAYSAVFLVGFVGNTSVVLVVYKNVRMQSSPTNIFIVNLAVADLLVIVVCVPFTLIGSITQGETIYQTVYTYIHTITWHFVGIRGKLRNFRFFFFLSVRFNKNKINAF
jgi:hypothetical protein